MTNSQILLQEIVNQEFTESEEYSNLTRFFEFFTSSQILKDYELSNEEINSSIIGGGNDGGCDSMFLFLNGERITSDMIDTLRSPRGSSLEFVIIQSKFTDGFGEDAIMKWKTVSENLMDMNSDVEQYKQRYVEDVRDMFMLFRNALKKLITSQPKVIIRYYYATLGIDVHPNVKSQAEELKNNVKVMYPTSKVDVYLINADQLMEMYNRESVVNVCIDLADQAITLGQSNEYVSLVNIGEYYKFITCGGDSLKRSYFESNVRDYQGTNSVNSCIADSLRNKTNEDFWWLNNGITVLSEKITLITNRKLSIDNPEVVNGLQTSTEIYNYFSEDVNRLKDEKRNVLVRFIVPDSEEVRDDIIFATNNQTNIPQSSLRVTDPIHLQIELYCKARGLFYDRRKNYYKNQKKKANEIISVSFLAQCLISILLRKPDFARARPSTLLTDDETYQKLYPANGDLSIYYKVGILGKRVQNNLRKTSEWSSAEKNDVLFYLLYAVVSKKLGKTNISKNDIINLDIDMINDDFINANKIIVYNKYKELGGNGRVAKSSTFVNDIDVLNGLSS